MRDIFPALVKALGMTVLAILLLASAAGATEYAYAVNSMDSTVSVIDTVTNKVVDTIDVGPSPQDIVVTPDGKKAYVTICAADGMVDVIDTATNKVVKEIPVEADPIHIIISPDGSKVYVSNMNSGTVSIISTATDAVVDWVNAETEQPGSMVISRDGSKVYVASIGAGTVSVFHTLINVVSDTIKMGNAPMDVAINPAGTEVYVPMGPASSIDVIDTASCTVKGSVSVEMSDNPCATEVNPAGTEIYVANEGGRSIHVIDPTTYSVITTIGQTGNPMRLAFNADGTKAYVTNFGTNTVSVIDTTTRKVVADVPVGNGPYGITVASTSFVPPPPGNTKPTTDPVSVNMLYGYKPGINWVYADADKDAQQKFELEVWTGKERTGTRMWSLSQETADQSAEYYGNALAADQTYYVSVRAFDGFEWGSWSEISFVPSAAPEPNVPPSAHPVTVTNTESFTPNISWAYSDPNKDPQLKYQIEVWTGQGGTGTNMWTSTQSSADTSIVYGGSKFESGTAYFVRVKVFDGTFWSPWSDADFAPYRKLTAKVQDRIAGMKSDDPRFYFDEKEASMYMDNIGGSKRDDYYMYLDYVNLFRAQQAQMLDRALFYAKQGDVARVDRYVVAADYCRDNAQRASENAAGIYLNTLNGAIFTVQVIQSVNQLAAGVGLAGYPALALFADVAFAAGDYVVNKNMDPEVADANLAVDAVFIVITNTKLPGLDGETTTDYIAKELASGKSQKAVYAEVDKVLADPQTSALLVEKLDKEMIERGFMVGLDKGMIKNVIKEMHNNLNPTNK